jgi:cytochrome P450
MDPRPDSTASPAPIPPTTRRTGPRAQFVNTLRRFRDDPLAWVCRMAAEPGDIVLYRIWGQDIFLVKHPDHVRDVLVTHQHHYAKGAGLRWAKRFLGEGLLTSEEEFHTRQRRLAQPAFHRQRIGAYATVMAEHAHRTREHLREGIAFDMHREMMALTLAVAAKTMCDADVESEANVIGEALTDVISLFPRFVLPFASLLHRLPLPATRRFERARARLDTVVYRMIEDRRRSGEDRGDLLSMLLMARDVEGDGGRMSDVQLRDEVMTLFLAGHETTANALSWTWYLLAENPEAEARLHEEVDEALGGRRPGFDDVPRLRYAEMVLAESMRLYPPAWGIGRRCVREHVLGGVTIPAGALVLMSPFLVQRDPRFFPDPLRFDPQRFTPEARAARPKFAYFPFGGGARQCIGEPFAWMEGVIVLATLSQRWRFRLVPGTRVEPEALITLRPRHGLPMTAERRSAALDARPDLPAVQPGA